jgi:hypothetical protein
MERRQPLDQLTADLGDLSIARGWGHPIMKMNKQNFIISRHNRRASLPPCNEPIVVDVTGSTPQVTQGGGN